MPEKNRPNKLIFQKISQIENIPSKNLFKIWVNLVLHDQKRHGELLIRIVDIEEMTLLNRTHRNKNKPTNVLSFPFIDFPINQAYFSSNFLGDIVICAPLVAIEANNEAKNLQKHWAHLTIHAVLHLLDYDHLNNIDAEIMEKLENQYLKNWNSK